MEEEEEDIVDAMLHTLEAMEVATAVGDIRVEVVTTAVVAALDTAAAAVVVVVAVDMVEDMEETVVAVTATTRSMIGNKLIDKKANPTTTHLTGKQISLNRPLSFCSSRLTGKVIEAIGRPLEVYYRQEVYSLLLI